VAVPFNTTSTVSMPQFLRAQRMSLLRRLLFLLAALLAFFGAFISLMLGFTLFRATVWSLNELFFSSNGDSSYPTSTPIWAMLVLALAFRFSLTGLKLLPRDADRTLNLDSRPPILYLRPFTADAEVTEKLRIPWWPLHNLIFRILLPRGTPIDSVIVGPLWAIGPVLAIRRPGEIFPPLGTIRLVVDKDDWRQDVLRWIDYCGLVVICAGRGSGLLWEVGEVLRSGAPRPLIVCCSGADAASAELEYQWFADPLERAIGIRLPERLQKSECLLINGNSEPRRFADLRGALIALEHSCPEKFTFGHYTFLQNVCWYLGIRNPTLATLLTAAGLCLAILLSYQLVPSVS
jgi:hypothetical protein